MYPGRIQEKKGYFYIVIDYRDSQNKRHSKWFPTGLVVKGNKKRAEALLAERRVSFVPPEEVTIAAADSEGILFADYLLKWVKIAKSTIRLSTYASYQQLIASAIDPYFRKRKITLTGLKASEIQDFYTEQLERVKPNTVIHYHAIIHRALKYAVKMDMIPVNPADKVDRPKKNEFTGSFYDVDEIHCLFSALEGSLIEVPVKLAAFYGLRRSEVIGLKWDAIDFKRDRIEIKHTVTRCNVDGVVQDISADTTKTKSSMRSLPLVPWVKELLLRAKAAQEENKRLCGNCYCKDYAGYICINEIGERLNPNYLSECFKRFLQSNDLRVIRFHDLRHSCASLMLASGVPLKQIQEWLGHSDFSTTANIYAHLDVNSKKTSAEALMNQLGFNADDAS